MVGQKHDVCQICLMPEFVSLCVWVSVLCFGNYIVFITMTYLFNYSISVSTISI